MRKKLSNKNVKKIVEFIPLSVYQTFIRRNIIVLFYHTASDKFLEHIGHLYPYKSLKAFESDLIYLKQHYNLISYKQFVEHISSGTKIKPNSLLLTFDDGYSECHSVIKPLLLKHKVPCIFFITTDFIDNKKMFYRNKVSLCIERINILENYRLTQVFNRINNSFRQCIQNSTSFIQWIKSLNFSEIKIIDEICTILGIDVKRYLMTYEPYLTSDKIKLLASDGFTIGAHSKSHRKLSLLCNKEIEQEIINSCKIIMELTGEKDIPFAFPFSGNGIDRSFLKNLTSKYKFIQLLFDANGLRKDKDFIINRIWSDLPPLSVENKSNIPQLLQCAYRKELKESMCNILTLFIKNNCQQQS